MSWSNLKDYANLWLVLILLGSSDDTIRVNIYSFQKHVVAEQALC